MLEFCILRVPSNCHPEKDFTNVDQTSDGLSFSKEKVPIWNRLPVTAKTAAPNHLSNQKCGFTLVVLIRNIGGLFFNDFISSPI